MFYSSICLSTCLFTSYCYRAVGLLTSSLPMFSHIHLVCKSATDLRFQLYLHQSFDEGFDRHKGFTNKFSKTSNLSLELIRPIWELLTLHQGHVHTPRCTWQRQWYHGVSTQPLGYHWMKKAWAVEQEECQALYGVSIQLHRPPCFSMM